MFTYLHSCSNTSRIMIKDLKLIGENINMGITQTLSYAHL